MFSLANLTLTPEETIPSPLYETTTTAGSNSSLLTLTAKQPNAKDLLFRPDSSGPIEIIPNLYLGNKVDSSTLELLRNARISHILNVTPDLPNAFEKCSEGKKFDYLRLAVQDNWSGDLVCHFAEAFEFIGKLVL